jgi:hypothetical protein
MTHLDEGTLVALRDAGPADEPTSGHLRDCPTCTDRLDEATARAVAVAEALASLDEPVDVRSAKVAVRRRLDAVRGGVHAGRGWWHAHVGRAAAVLLLTAGAASALPWSPVRDWWAGAPAEPLTGSDPAGGVGATQGSPPAGISVAVPRGSIAVIVRGAEPGSVIEVVWVDRPTARVSAPAGSQFTYADGRAEVDAAAGPVEVELPRDAALASLEVDGRLFLERSGEHLDVPGPAVTRSDARLRFLVPAR